MLPGKQYTPEDLLRILRRRIWVILCPFAIVAAATAVAARKLPDLYRSDALILVVPQQVPQDYVRSAVTMRLEDRLQSIQQQIMSRTKLEEIIKELNLYEKERRNGIMEDIVERMRKDIKVDPIRAEAFSVGFVGGDAKTVQKVAEKLASLFITESLSDRERLTEGTNQFLEGQVDLARRRLIEQEKKLQDFRAKYSGQLPSQLDANLRALGGVQTQLQNLLEVDNRESDRRLTYEHSLKDLEEGNTAALAAPASVSASSEGPASVTGGTAAQRLQIARAQLKALQLQGKTDDHPDVVSWKRLIATLEDQARQEALAQPVSAADGNPIETARQAKMQQLRDVIAQIDKQAAVRTDEEKKLQTQAAVIQQHIDAVPQRESDLTELTRDYPTLGQLYNNLVVKKEESTLAANLERRQIGEQFHLLDPARVPEKPFSPNRHSINAYGMLAGLAIGLALVAFFEYRDSTFATDDEIASLLSLPVLAVVPVMRSERDEQRTRKRRLFMGVALGSGVAFCLAVVAYTFVR
jgi:polysaccharide chain length determinant protein (PEP-CTERM system associated)